jgi:hypothetical protein
MVFFCFLTPNPPVNIRARSLIKWDIDLDTFYTNPQRITISLFIGQQEQNRIKRTRTWVASSREGRRMRARGRPAGTVTPFSSSCFNNCIIGRR